MSSPKMHRMMETEAEWTTLALKPSDGPPPGLAARLASRQRRQPTIIRSPRGRITIS